MIVEEHFVAFIDILGFSDKVKSDFSRAEIDDSSHLGSIHQAILAARALVVDGAEVEVQQFSDSIIVYTKFAREAFIPFITACATLQANLIKLGILVRGGVTYGKHYADDGVVYSQALIDAYQLESQEAIDPRIVMSENLIFLMFENEAGTLASGRVEMDRDRHFFIKFKDLMTQEEREGCISRAAEMRRSCRGRVAAKHQWLCEYLA